MAHKRTKKRKPSSFTWLLVTLSMLILCTGSMYTIKTYQNPTLYGKWVSKSTGEKLEFKEDGTVLLEGVTYSPSFSLPEPNKMLYTIGDKVFNMCYNVEGRTLEWGTERGEKEIFVKR